MKYAVIQLAGKQYKVSVGDKFAVNRLDLEDGKTLTVSDVLLMAEGESVEIGAPLLSGKTVTLQAVSEQKADKIRVAKYRAKSRYRKVHGHRQTETTVEVVKMS